SDRLERVEYRYLYLLAARYFSIRHGFMAGAASDKGHVLRLGGDERFYLIGAGGVRPRQQLFLQSAELGRQHERDCGTDGARLSADRAAAGGERLWPDF